MASSLSTINFYSPFSSERVTKSSCSKLPPLLRKTRRAYCSMVKAMAREGKDNPDHLQRATQQQPRPKERAAQTAPIGLWDRFPTARTVQQMMDTMERMVEDPFANSSTWPTLSTREINRYNKGRIPWEIKEGEEDYKMRFDMPGMTKNDVKVWVEDSMLVTKAEKLPKNRDGELNVDEDDDANEEEWLAKIYGRYSSRIVLPENSEIEKIKAEVKDGVLYITIPKANSTSKIIDINVQ